MPHFHAYYQDHVGIYDIGRVERLPGSLPRRQELIHPRKGMHQVMFRIELAEKDGNLVVEKVIPPQIDSAPIDRYAQDVLKHAQDFSVAFLALFRDTVVSNQRLGPT